ncbi:MAG: hypothetical protein K2O70_01635, partial [Desulfovibrionaceae bacterium]|nr:hypothetical protein [Desulfovibrionaceae bacterium]
LHRDCLEKHGLFFAANIPTWGILQVRNSHEATSSAGSEVDAARKAHFLSNPQNFPIQPRLEFLPFCLWCANR